MEYVNRALDWLFMIVDRTSGAFSVSPYDVIFIFFIFAFFLGFGFQYGKVRIVTLVFSLYFSSFIVMQFPYADRLLGARVGDIELTALIVSGIFLFFIGVYVLFNRITNVIFPANSAKRWLEAAILSAVTTAFIIALSYHVLPIEAVHDFSEPIDRIFASEEAFFWWLMLPLVVLFFIGKQRE